MQRIATIIAASLIALAGAAQSSENGRPAPAIESIGVLYDVDAPFGSRGISLSVVRREGGGYAYETYSRGLGLARLVIASDALESTRFDFDGAGLVRPLEYLCRSCDGRKDGLVNIAYDWANLNAVFSGQGQAGGIRPGAPGHGPQGLGNPDHARPRGKAAAGCGTDAGRRETEALRRTVGRRGDAEHCRGRTSNRSRYRRQREGSENFQYLWYASELGWLPARWEIFRKKRRVIIIEATEYRWGEEAALAMREDWLDR